MRIIIITDIYRKKAHLTNSLERLIKGIDPVFLQQQRVNCETTQHKHGKNFSSDGFLLNHEGGKKGRKEETLPRDYKDDR